MYISMSKHSLTFEIPIKLRQSKDRVKHLASAQVGRHRQRSWLIRVRTFPMFPNSYHFLEKEHPLLPCPLTVKPNPDTLNCARKVCRGGINVSVVKYLRGSLKRELRA
jgi:hypothetical protein